MVEGRLSGAWLAKKRLPICMLGLPACMQGCSPKMCIWEGDFTSWLHTVVVGIWGLNRLGCDFVSLHTNTQFYKRTLGNDSHWMVSSVFPLFSG